ncbi:MAG: hypothetical protein K0S09_634 [Sphingobacteriaceae bacterium]|jgi:hypothetical protein|nr:hypothetical protein [Sphingobacteriaceae bacterium]
MRIIGFYVIMNFAVVSVPNYFCRDAVLAESKLILDLFRDHHFRINLFIKPVVC